MKNYNKLLIYRKKMVKPYIDNILTLLDAVSYIMALLFVLALIYHFGFIVPVDELRIVYAIYDLVWSTLIINSLLKLCLRFRDTVHSFSYFTWALTFLLYLSLIPVLTHEPHRVGTWDSIWMFLDGHIYTNTLVGIISMLHLASGVVKMLSKRVNPSFIFSVSFLIIILIGSGMLMLPRATHEGITFLDALFMSTSATCVTGLTTVDVASVFTPMGILFLMALIQIGGLGVMTLTSFFAVFFTNNSSLYNQVMMADMVSSKSLNSLWTTLLYILGFTLIIESVGAVVIFANIHNTMDMSLHEEIFFSIFHSISAFCNAGFSTMPNNLGHELLMRGHNIFYIAISLLIILGGVGFPILVNLYQSMRHKARKIYHIYIARSTSPHRDVHLYDTNTRVVLIMTAILLGMGTLSIALFEWNNSLAGMPVWDKIVHSFFNAACPRTAGFSSVAISSFGVQTILIIIFLMIIGGGTQSTAGGVKVNVFAVVLLNIRAILYGDDKVTVFSRELSGDSIRRSNSTLVLYLLLIAIALFALTITEPEASLLALIFEAISALSTVGASLDLTPTLSSAGKMIIIFLMFIGRVGVLTILYSIIRQRKVQKVRYPTGNIIIN